MTKFKYNRKRFYFSAYTHTSKVKKNDYSLKANRIFKY